MLHIELVPPHLKHLVIEFKSVLTDVIKKDLESNTIKTAEEYAALYIPAIDPLYKSFVALVQKAIDTCTTIQEADWTGCEARLALLVTELTHLKDGGQHGIGRYFTWCQIVIDWIIGKDNPA